MVEASSHCSFAPPFRSRLTHTWKTQCVKFAFVSLDPSSAETRSVETHSSLHLGDGALQEAAQFIKGLYHCALDKITSESVFIGPSV